MKTSRLHILGLCSLGLMAVAAVAAMVEPSFATFILSYLDPQTVAGIVMAEGAVVVDPVKIKEALDKITDLVKEEGVKLKAETDKLGTASSEQKAVVDKLLTEQGALKAQLLDIEQKMAKRAEQGDVDPESLQAVMAKSWMPAVETFLASRGLQSSASIPLARKALVNSGVTGAALNYPGYQALPTPLPPLVRRLTVRDLMSQGRITKSILFYMRETGYTNNAAMVSEGSLKPKSELTFELQTDPVRTLAHLFDISLQMLDDVPFIESYIATRGMYGLKLVEENQLLMGSGVGQNLEGVYTAATAYSQPAGVTINAATETDIDKLRLAMLQVELADAFTTGIVLHPTDWAGIELLKDTQNSYLFVNPQNVTEARLWGRPVVSTKAMTQGRFLVGDFAAHAQIFDRQDANMQISYENKDNFERNMATIRIEERLALAVYRPEAFVKGTLESAS